MTKKHIVLACIAALAAALPAVSQADVAFNIGATTDYRYRGISQTRLQPALQGGVDYSNGPFYLGAWASTIKWTKDAGGGGDVEIDLYGGVKGAISKELSYDVGVLTYQYPSNRLNPSANTTEIYGALTYGPSTLKYSHSVTDLFGVSDSKNSGYLDFSATFDLGSDYSVVPHIGYTRVAHNSDFNYADYSLTLAKDFKTFVVSGALVGADLKAYAPNGKRLDRAGLVVAVKFNF